jgi:tRNA(Ile)-lysidine synthase
LKLIIAHLNHGVRKESDNDEKFVKALAEKNKLTFASRKIAPPTFGNLEEELRNERKKFLNFVAERFDANHISLAHNKNDQVETFFLNAIRGSGPAGLSAMDAMDGKIIRPLLNISRDEIKDYAKKRKLVWREDKTNKDVKYNRNLLRTKILPELKKINPEWLENVYRTTLIQNDIDNYLKSGAKRIIKSQKQLDVNTLNKLNKPLFYEVLAISYEKIKGNRKNLSLKNLDDIRNLLQKTSGTKEINLPGNIIAKRHYDKLDFLLKKEDNKESEILQSVDMKIGKNRFKNWTIAAVKTDKPDKPNKNIIYIDFDNLNNLKIRIRKPGDKITVTNVGTKKLQDIFVDAKVNIGKRELWPIVYDKNTNEIIWIPNLEFNSLKLKQTEKIMIKLTAKEE